MTRELKILVLITILIIPACIYIFLRTFGVNEFSLPVYPVGELKGSPLSSERGKYDQKMVFPDLYDVEGHIFDQGSLAGDILILEIVATDDDITRREYQLNRIAGTFSGENTVHLLRIIEKGNTTHSNNGTFKEKNANTTVCYSDHEATKNLTGLLFQTGENNKGQNKGTRQLVLIDTERNVRGFYNMDEFEEMDRLILEVKILLTQNTDV
jgi:protein SCO1/2